MITGLVLILIIVCINPFSLLNVLKSKTFFIHEWCVQRLPAENKIIYSALLCGEKLPEGEIKNTFISLGVIHLMVISGAHLIFLEKLWNILPAFRLKKTLLVIFLLLYSMSAGLNPPVLRALFSLLLARINKELKLFWSPYLRVHISGLLCLLCQISWFQSLSLQLSWIASMGMSNHRISRLQSCTLTFLLILPIVSSWGGIHPFSIFINWLLTPLAGCILLPLSLLVIPFPFVRFFTDALWGYFLQIMNLLKPLVDNNKITLNESLSSFQIWIYICIIFILLHTFHVHSMRNTRKI